MRRRQVLQALAGARSVLMDTAGVGLLAMAAFTWSVSAGFAVAGLGLLVLNWRLGEDGE